MTRGEGLGDTQHWGVECVMVGTSMRAVLGRLIRRRGWLLLC